MPFLIAGAFLCRGKIWVPPPLLASVLAPLILWVSLWAGLLYCTDTLNWVAASLFSELLLTYASWKNLCSSWLWWRSDWCFKAICRASTVKEDGRAHDSMRAAHNDKKPNFIVSFPKSQIVIMSKGEAQLNNRPPRVLRKTLIWDKVQWRSLA